MLVGEGFKVLEGDYKNDILYNKLKKKIGPGARAPLGPTLVRPCCLVSHMNVGQIEVRKELEQKKRKRYMCVREKKKEEKKWKIKRSWAISNHISYNADIHTPIS